MTRHIDDVSEETRTRIYALIKDLEMIVAERKDLEAAETELKEMLISELAENELDYVETDHSKIRYTAPSVSMKLDSKKLRQDLPDLYEQYLCESERKGFIAVTIKSE
ncbi:hypothetical protein MmiAt1_16150 [Methanimicrococcus sp. At1]|uniref:Uncharacterized protein n=1 Tax=Methanimicrococcus hacksteinii TaxID=3028293 RepID=A0ABU3VSW1_9EURY|nr:hypothetical protein [Methanimicrococcus sp. At1]MDV0446005.1 hypothetical protein [Methanimicrococcus sp. At1]